MDIKERIKDLPDSPGVYLMKDKDGQIIYIGKASSIRHRVASYFQRSRYLSSKKEAMVSHTKEIDYIVTGSKAEALIFEASLIKKNQPRYNVTLRDDKSYPFLKLTTNEDYPRIFIVRKKKEDGARYYGPYTEVKLLREALKSMKKIFPLRTCKVLPKTICLNYHIGQCLGPCAGKIDKISYDSIVKEICLFLSGRRDELLKELSKKMEEASKDRRFEDAGKIRDQICALTHVIIHKKKPRITEQIYELKEALGLRSFPRRIEAFDCSNIMGHEATGSMVSFFDGKPYKAGYRKFRIKEVDTIDDYRMIREVVARRYRKAIEGKEPLPDLIMIDGGKGHLSCAWDELKKLGLDGVQIIGIAKEFEHVYLPDRKNPVILPPSSKALLLIRRIRDEAHRFAISYHHMLRKKVTMESVLDEIPGIGEKRKTDLIKYFGSVDEIKKAKEDDLLKVKNINEKIAKRILDYFNPKQSPK